MLTLFIVLLLGIAYRIYGFFVNHPFWVDEFSTAIQSEFVLKYGLNVFFTKEIYFEHHNILTHFLTAALFNIFGKQEWVARLPALFFGSFVPVLIFVLARYLFNYRTAVSAALLSSTSYFLITWSRQARSYTLLQFIILLSTYLYLKIIDQKNAKKNYAIILFLLLLLLGFLTHSFFYIFIIAIVLHFSLTKIDLLRHNYFPAIIVAVIFALFAIKIKLFETFLIYLRNGGFVANNLWYYHSLLWREYGLLSFLSLAGFIAALSNKNKNIVFVISYLTLHFVFISFIFGPYSSRYVLPVFPFLLILMAYFISEVSYSLFSKKNNLFATITTLTLTLFIIINGHKFVSKPKKFYSVNHDFRDIAIIDYKQVFDFIKVKGRLAEKQTAVIETWPARIYWYLGLNYHPSYIFKWKNHVPYNLTTSGEKIVPQTNKLILIENLADFQKAMQKNKRGFIFIDDATLPRDVIDFAEENLKKELYLDHYTFDDNPYSLWSATLYSWGI